MHARQLNMQRRYLSQEQKRGLIEAQLRDTPERSNRQIAAGLGVNHETVGAARERLEATGEIRQLDRTIGADGKSRPASYSAASPSTPAPAEQLAALPDKEKMEVIIADAPSVWSVGRVGEGDRALLTHCLPVPLGPALSQSHDRNLCFYFNGEPAGTRTQDHLIKSYVSGVSAGFRRLRGISDVRHKVL